MVRSLTCGVPQTLRTITREGRLREACEAAVGKCKRLCDAILNPDSMAGFVLTEAEESLAALTAAIASPDGGAARENPA